MGSAVQWVVVKLMVQYRQPVLYQDTPGVVSKWTYILGNVNERSFTRMRPVCKRNARRDVNTPTGLALYTVGIQA